MNDKSSRIQNLIMLHIILLFYSLSSVASKTAALKPLFSIPFFKFYGIVLIILLIYAILWQQVLKHLPLTMAYANKAITTIWGMLWGSIFFGESISKNMILGALIIIFGVYMVVTANE